MHSNPYKESLRYIENAESTLKLAGIDGKFYIDEKYVKTACGTAYSGVLKALDFLFEIKKVPKRKGRKSIEYYQSELSKIDKRLLNNLNSSYRVLHLEGYYEGEKGIKVIEAGFEYATSIIESLLPYSKN
jgi:hypothetical protein